MNTSFGRMAWVTITCFLSGLAVDAARAGDGASATGTGLRFEVSVAESLGGRPRSGRLMVALNSRDGREPRTLIGHTSMAAEPVLGRDVVDFSAKRPAVLDRGCAIYPIESLDAIKADDYRVQAVLLTNRDLWLVDAPGNLYSEPVEVHIDPAKGGTVKLVLDSAEAEEHLPKSTDQIKYVKLRSELLSKFHGRPMYLRAGIILPRGFDEERERRYPLRVHIGGFGTRFTAVRWMMASTGFRRVWMADDTPRMILLHLDGAGPYGDPYQVNSANNGPYGDAVTTELIPYVEKMYRGIGEPWARVLEGGSTGGWVSLGLQVFYPDFFNGCWSGFPDGVDFRAFELINIYKDENAYVNRHHAERPSMRETNGDVIYTVRNECQRENVIGLGDRWTMSGLDWGSWNAVYGPRGKDGRPIPLWDPRSGVIDHAVAKQWRKYDLRRVLETNWEKLGPKLQGKLHIWVGDADDYFLNNAVHLLDDFLTDADPPYRGRIEYGAGKGHGWMAISERAMIKEMGEAMKGPGSRGAGVGG